VIPNFLAAGDAGELEPYSGERFRSRFLSRIWMRRIISGVRQPLMLEAACAVLRLPPFKQLAWHVFFGRGSFPDVEAHEATGLSSVKAST
jgi:hypothetical protein